MKRQDTGAALGNIALVLSGGGAKGAYELGLFRALRERGLMQQVTAVSGTSIGSLNALLFSTGRPMIWNGVWRRLAKLLASSGEGRKEGELRSTEGMTAALALLTRLPGVLGKRPLFACTFDLETQTPAYFDMSVLSPREAATVCTASCAMPEVFQPVRYRGRSYCDGGLPPQGDRLPTAPLRGLGCDTVLVCYLVPGDRADLSGFPAGTRFLELHPSRALEKTRHAGTLDFSPEILATHEALGYADARALLENCLEND